MNFYKINYFILKRELLKFMRTLILFLLIILACSPQPNGKNWYVSNTSSGNASGDSWANKRAFTSFNTALAQPGDTVFIDGGLDSLVYNLSTTLFIKSTGTAANPIVYTRGVTAGHNGVPVFTSANNITLIYFDNWNGLLAQYIDWSYTKLRPTNGAGVWSIVANRTTNINLYHNEIDYTYGAGIAFGMVDNVKIMYNNIYTKEIANPSSVLFIQNDAIKSNNSNNWEIAYNTIINRTSIPFSDQSGEPHRDLMQLEGHNLNGGTTLIHHNFFGTFFQDDSCFTNTLKANRAGGSFIFYNNIFALYRNGGDIFTVSANGETVPRSLYIYNNTIIQTKSKATPYQNSYLSTVTNLVFKNNLISIEEGAFFTWAITGLENIDFDYNIYNRAIPITSTINYSTWKSTYGQDANSLTTGFTLADNDFNTFSKSPEDYRLVKGSSGIDEGISLSSYFTDDFIGTKRPQGSAWDIGAFEIKDENIVISDNIPPNLINAINISSTSLQLTFSEELDSISAQLKSNYSINNSIIINSATLSSDKKTVTLFTSSHLNGQTYTITVTGVKDLAGNIISSNNSLQYTFVDNTVGDLKANVKVFLQGAYQNGSMQTNLKENELLPVSQPYNISPWNYNGSEVLGSGSSAIVDWVLVELRNSNNPAIVVARRAALLKDDGNILDTDGSTGVTFKNLAYGSYYISVRHRNHLSVMSAVPKEFAPNNLYDFTKSQTSAFGQNSMAEIATGVYGMYAGDGDGNGNINEIDRNDIWSIQNGNMGYLNGDFNLDSGVTVKDTNDYWNMNQGKIAQLP